MMTTIVVTSLEKIQTNHSLYTTQIVDNSTSTNVDIAITTNASIVAHNKILPFNRDLAEGQKVYFDLAAYSFFEHIHAAISAQEEKCGVLRFRRSGEKNGLVGDLFVLTQLFGTMQQVHISSRELAEKKHIIVLCKLGDNVMAHIEYTATEQERIEFEFSSPQHIIEFDSAEMVPNNPYKAPQYNIDTINKFAVNIDDILLEKLHHLEQLVGGECV
ncbi:hypothetical protein [Solibacillus sp. CAU 1738]|uniref:hypothetical protein n=1 Tax=Solibacillus sp. CAU 1738 TaxID=3140363 RepID=UPI003261BD6F